MARTLGAVLAERGPAMVGRQAELERLLSLLDGDRAVVAVVHGVAGCGKSTLVQAFRAAAAARGARVVAVDGRDVEPTRHGFLCALGRALGTHHGDAIAALASGDDPVVVTIDTAERLRLLDGWLRETFVPALPEHARVVLATRDAPGAVWRASLGALLETLALGPLHPADAAVVLERAGLDEDQADWVNSVVHGHPLSLTLAASAIRERPGAGRDAVLPALVQELAELYLDGVDDATRRALDATSVLRRVTCSLLAAVLPDEPTEAAFERLAALPFVELGGDGLVVHDAVREAVAALLAATDPVRHRAYRLAAWRQIRRELADAAGRARWPSLADMIHLVHEPLVREAFFPSKIQHYAVALPRPEDRDAIAAIAERHETPEHVELLLAWWSAVPGAFRVARDPRGDVVAFTILCELGDVPQRLLARDPLCAPWRAHLRSHPIERGERVLLARAALAWGTGSAPSPCLTALLRELERASLEAGPALRRIYSDIPADGLLAQVRPLGFVAVPGARAVRLGGRVHRPIYVDLGPESVAGWLTGLAASDLPAAGTVLDEQARELRLDGRTVTLTALECEVLRYLRDREAQVVGRETLLRDVWGYTWTGGSNVVEVAVSGLRRKLGDRAAALQTVRGVGYRLQPL